MRKARHMQMQFGINVILCELIENRLDGDNIYLFAPKLADQWLLLAKHESGRINANRRKRHRREFVIVPHFYIAVTALVLLCPSPCHRLVVSRLQLNVVRIPDWGLEV